MTRRACATSAVSGPLFVPQPASAHATTAAGFRPCETIKGAGDSTLKVFARPASMSCQYARVVARHANPYGGKPDFQGWRCYHFPATLQTQGKLFECTKGKRYVQGRTR